jgi:hypothetical protein
MAYDIEVDGPLPRAVHRRLVELVGSDAIDERPRRVVVSTRDQAAMIGIINWMNDLGLCIDRIQRT